MEEQFYHNQIMETGDYFHMDWSLLHGISYSLGLKAEHLLKIFPLALHTFSTTTARRFRMLDVYSSFNFLHKFFISVAN